ncbi:MAG: site-specific DNA-methyltransferase [Peptostreptococcus sp.]|uniref:site-specific DNA-methyltransferase n=1 Tax=Peptostreptococcus sp. TaxID=1262 RepID=UPI00290AE491|nr:site-specific DNA-methyltransferase [Peptostreptococcus sp.]MDU5349988.1 site-specific DNA-methyltransferase [Peptostreptococcus sp.]MDU5891824.1 site-specific DNA-methyltransferase [Peptostreptococcus sp.]
MKFLDELKKVLSFDERFVGESNQIIKTKVSDAARNNDKKLLKALLNNDLLKEAFFTIVDDIYVFDKNKFIWILESKEFLPDSFTMYKNKIGLVDSNNNLISQKQDVSLVWAYKDCVLEGGQTKEDQKRDEIFYNETLAPDQVNRLLAPKVLGNAKRYTKEGIEENIEFKEDDNLIIKGNNLLALSSLLERYEGQVQLIYIDPPFNTGNDGFKYNDSFNQSSWLTFMKNRLTIAKNLLTDTGTIYVQLDHNQVHYAKVLMDEIFGPNNFQREIIWSNETSSGFKAQANNWIRGHDNILFYSNNEKFLFNKLYHPLDEKTIKRYDKVDEKGERFKQYFDNGKERRVYLKSSKGKPMSDVWTDIIGFQTSNRGGETLGFDGQKSEALIKRIIEASTNEGDYVLDYHLGSGTTASSAIKMNRKFIGIEQMDYIDEIAVERLKRAIDGELVGISKSVNWQGGGSFVYCELLEDNESLVNELEKAENTGQVKIVLNKAIDNGKLIPSVLPSDLKESQDEFDKLSLDEQKNIVMELLNKNQLYVNLSDIDDEDYKVSEADKAFTISFYGKE